MDELLSTVADAADLFAEIGADTAAERGRLERLHEQLVEVRLHVAVLGQFKRGKSTLLNALLGEPLLPFGVTPVTSIPTWLSGGPQRLVRVIFQDGRHQEFASDDPAELAATLVEFISERANPHNERQVDRVEVEHPSHLLQRGVVFIDTPGIGSTFQHNTQTTFDLLPQCDAALFVVSADPPVTEVEVDFFQAVQRHVARAFYVLNKADCLDEADREEVVEFLRSTLATKGVFGEQLAIWVVSARQGLEARVSGNVALWADSGMAVVEQHLLDFLAEDKERTVRAAVSSKAEALVIDALFRVRLQGRTLDLSLAELEQRLATFEAKVKEAEQQRLTLQDLLDGDRRRVIAFINEEATLLNKRICDSLAGVVEGAATPAGNPAELARIGRARTAEAIPQLFEELFTQETATIDQRLQAVLTGHQERADELICSVQQTAAELFEIPYGGVPAHNPLEIRHRPYWTTHDWSSLFNPIPISPSLLERLLPMDRRMRRLKHRLVDEATRLVSRNVENLRWAVVQNVEDSFRSFALDLDQNWERIITAIRGAVEMARGRLAAMDAGADRERERLRTLERQCLELAHALRLARPAPVQPVITAANGPELPSWERIDPVKHT